MEYVPFHPSKYPIFHRNTFISHGIPVMPSFVMKLPSKWHNPRHAPPDTVNQTLSFRLQFPVPHHKHWQLHNYDEQREPLNHVSSGGLAVRADTRAKSPMEWMVPRGKSSEQDSQIFVRYQRRRQILTKHWWWQLFYMKRSGFEVDLLLL